MKYIATLLLIIITLFMPKYVYSQEVWTMSLFFDGSSNQLRLDRFVDNPVQKISSGESSPIYYDIETLNRAGYSESEVYRLNFQGFEQGYDWNIYVSLTQQNGAFQLSIPYIEHAQSLQIVDPRGSLLEVDLSEFSQCNQNSICELEQEETTITCPSDCTGESIQFSESTQQSLRENQGRIQSEDGTVLLETTQDFSDQQSQNTDGENTESNYLYLLGGIVLIAGALGGWVLVHFRK